MSATVLNKKAHIVSWGVILLQICVLLGEQGEWFVAVSDDFCRFKLDLPSLLFMTNNDGKTSLKRQKSSGTTTDTQDVGKFYWFYVKNVHISKYLSL